MTTQLIPVFAGELSGAPVQLVDARLLHTFLEVGKDFSTWIKDRIRDYSFIENIDFLLPKYGEPETRGFQKAIDYHLSIDMAKELGMIERNDKGRQIRRYFLEMERLVKNGIANPLGTAYQELIAAHQQEIDRLHVHTHGLQAELLDLYRFKVATLEGKIEKPVRRSTRPVTEEEKAEIIRLHDVGMTRDEIAEQLDRGKTSIYYTLRDAGKLGGAA